MDGQAVRVEVCRIERLEDASCRRPATDAWLDPGPPAVELCEAADHRKPQSEPLATHLGVDAQSERLEDLLHELVADTRTGVVDDDHELLGGHHRTDPNARLRRRVTDRLREQVLDDALDDDRVDGAPG